MDRCADDCAAIVGAVHGVELLCKRNVAPLGLPVIDPRIEVTRIGLLCETIVVYTAGRGLGVARGA